MSLKFYHKGIETFDKNLQEKIKKDATRCWWHDSDDRYDKDFTGYIGEDGFCYDVCACIAKKAFQKMHQEAEIRERAYVDKFMKIKNAITSSINIIDKFTDSISQISEIKTKIRSTKKKIDNGYVIQDFNLRGGKKTRRYKKDNRRFLTDKEIVDLKQDLSNLDNLESELSKKIKLEEVLEQIISNMYDIKEPIMHYYNYRFEWHETVGLYKDYLECLKNLKLKINHFTFNNIKEKYEIQNRELDTSLEEVTIFEETFEKVMERVEEDKRIEEMMSVKNERKVTKKAKFYIDENGKRVELDQSIDQVVIHR